jgi:hypothetical protein
MFLILIFHAMANWIHVNLNLNSPLQVPFVGLCKDEIKKVAKNNFRSSEPGPSP